MATLADLKTRIITETNRDDLLDDLANALNLCIQQAIEFYADTRFWFNELRTTSVATIGNEYLPIPAGVRMVDELFLLIGGVRYPLSKCQLTDIESLYATPLRGQPTNWAEYVGTARLWPTPNLAYTFIWLGLADVTPALDYSLGTSTNAWTNEGQDLIDARARFLLYRDYFRDVEGVAIAKDAEAEALSSLLAKGNRLMSTGRIRPSW